MLHLISLLVAILTVLPGLTLILMMHMMGGLVHCVLSSLCLNWFELLSTGLDFYQVSMAIFRSKAVVDHCLPDSPR